MGELDFWFYICLILTFVIIRMLFKIVRLKRKLKSVNDKPAFTRVKADSIQETKNIAHYLLDREAGCNLLSKVSIIHCDKIMEIDESAFKKASHPGLIAAVRAAHLAGFTLSVRLKEKVSEEQEANSKDMIHEHVSKVEPGR